MICFASGKDKQPEFVFSTGRLMRHQNVIYLLPLDQVVVLAPLSSGEILKRPFDEIRVRGSNKLRTESASRRSYAYHVERQNAKTKKWLNDQQVPNWWRRASSVFI